MKGYNLFMIYNYLAYEGIEGCGVAVKPPHHTPHPSTARLLSSYHDFNFRWEDPA